MICDPSLDVTVGGAMFPSYCAPSLLCADGGVLMDVVTTQPKWFSSSHFIIHRGGSTIRA